VTPVTEHQATILVVDDNPANLDVLRALLTRDGYRVRVATSGAQAIRSARARPPDMILLDVNMPEMDGFEACAHLVAEPALAGVPVLFVSAEVDAESVVYGLAMGAVDYITKPVRAEELRARVEAHLALRHTRLELERQNAELKRAQAMLVQSEKMAAVGVLTAGIAHELNNPINYLRSSAHTLQRLVSALSLFCEAAEGLDLPQGSPARAELDELVRRHRVQHVIEGAGELAGNITMGADRAAEIVEGLRSFSRLDKAEQEVVDLHDGIEATLLLLRHRTKGGVVIERDFGVLPPVRCFPGKLNQLLMNLLVNAIDAVEPEGAGRVCVRTRVVEADGTTWAGITIDDSGPGVPPDRRDRIFEPFYTTKPLGRGVGLGLSISYGIAREHEGVIRVGESPSGGARFEILLPLTPPTSEERHD
jgi:two-component system, NtrC family, sensor kinase